MQPIRIKIFGGFILQAPKFFRIKNWEKYHHRDHKKSMPWIKLDAFIFQDARFKALSDNMKLIWIGLLTLSAKNGNRFIWDSASIRRGLDINCYVKLEQFLELGLIEECFNDGHRVEDAPSPSLEERRGEERRFGATLAPPPAPQEIDPPKPKLQSFNPKLLASNTDALAQWEFLRSIKRYEPFPELSPRTKKALQAIGGIIAIYNMQADQIKFRRDDFCAAYNSKLGEVG